MGLRVQKLTGKVTNQCQTAVGNASFDHAPRILRFLRNVEASSRADLSSPRTISRVH